MYEDVKQLHSKDYFKNGEQVYIEMPYEGIYKADRKLFELVLRYFEE